ncbi:MAG TPA: MCE family protein, partial [Mycobacterium sp.]|nr:MCE family protein [Mycobacterium sp.]
MLSRRRLAAAAGVILAGLIVAATALIVHQAFLRPKTITAYFTTATATYPGDDVRISGVKVGSIAAVQPEGTQVKMTLHVGRGVPVPADAKAVIIAQNLVAARYVQLTPAYRGSSGPTMRDGAVIPLDHTAVPVEWDEVKTQLMRLATDLGPNGQVSTPSVARFIDSAANALAGNGEKLRQTLAQLSGVGRILGDGSGNIVDIIKNLQTFVTALRDSNTQIVQFQDRFATLTSVVNESRSDLDAALNNLSVAVGEVQRFIAGTRDKASEQIVRLADVTQNLVDHRMALENVLHIAPNGLANWHGMYNPDTGSQDGIFVFSNFANPVWLFCSQMQAIENITSLEEGKLCAQHLGAAARLMNFNYMPLPTNLLISKAGAPENVIYTDPALIPCHRNWDKTCEGDINGSIPRPPETPPAVSAYSGLPGENIPNWGPGAFWAPPPPAPPHPASLPPEPPAAAPPAAAPPAPPAAPGSPTVSNL